MRPFIALCTTLAILFAGPRTATAAGSTATVLAMDISRSVRAVFAELQGAALDLVESMPDGETLTILEVGTTATPVLTTSITSASRVEAVETLQRMTPRASHSDLGASLATSSSLLALSSATSRRIVLFTDADPQPANGTHFQGRSFADLLADPHVLDPHAQLVLVLPDDVRVTAGATSPNVRIVKASDWKAARPRAPEPSAPLPAVPTVDVALWDRAAAGTILVCTVLLVAGAAAGWYRRRGAPWQARALAEGAPLLEEAPPAPAAPRLVPGFIVHMGDREIPLHTERRPVVIGDHWNADAPMPTAAGRHVRLSIRRGLLHCENTGNAAIRIGDADLLSGQSGTLRRGVVHLYLGTDHVVVIPSDAIAVDE
jgi:hypothetical protein